MRIIKIFITLIMLLMLTIYLPVNVKASTNNNDKIITERQLFNGKVINLDDLLLARGTRIIKETFVRSMIISVTRRNASTGINMEVFPKGHYVEVAIFKHNSQTEIIGNARIANKDVWNALSWTDSELGDTLDVDVFITAYSDVSVNITGSITF